ncbi:MAG: hypothetical protein ACXWLY_04050 [Thermoanaerobaculia bacterium]
MKREWTKYLWLAFAVSIGIAILLAAWPRLFQDAPSNVIYFSDGYGSGGGKPLFVITATDAGFTVKSGRLPCAPSTGNATSPFPIADRAEFTCGSHLLQLRRDGTATTLVSVGLAGLTPPFVVGSGRPIVREAAGTPRFVYRGPAVAVRHLIANPPATCGGVTPPEAAFCAQNNGATGSMVVFSSDGTVARPRRGRQTIVRVGDVMWLGYVPFVVERNDAAFTLRVMLEDNRRSWRAQRGDRAWMGLELPSWPLGRHLGGSKPTIHRVLSETALYSPGNLTEERSEPEQEEQLQLVIDEELLCLDFTPDATGLHPRLAWRNVANPGCSEVSLSSVANNLADPPSEAAVRAYEQVQSEPRFGDLLSKVAHDLEDADSTGDTEGVLLFDHRYVQVTRRPGEREVIRAPVALLGVRPNVTMNRIRRPKATNPLEIHFDPGTTSPLLEPTVPNTANLPLLLLAARGRDAAHPSAMMVCLNVELGQRLQLLPSALALGAVSITASGVFWTADPSGVTAAQCVELVRQGATVTARSLGDIAATHHPATGSPDVPIPATPLPLASGDRLTIGGVELTFREASDVAAKAHPSGSGRMYPFGADASALLGIGSLSHGVEGGMTRELRLELATKALDAAPNTVAPPLQLTIDGDLQRIVSRQLAATFDQLRPGSDRGMYAAAVLLDAETGAILASATAPRFDPFHEPADTRLLQQAATGIPSSEFRRRVENTAFLRNLPIGSTMKVATSIAMMRGGMALSGELPSRNGKACRTLTVSQAGGARRDPFDCDHGDHNVMTNDGKPDPQLWLEAFRSSCNVYFGAAAGELVPSLADAFSYGPEGPVVTIPAAMDPAVALRPGSTTPRTSVPGNAFYETLLLLGYRFDFEDSEAIDNQHIVSYGDIRFPTVDDPWLRGFEPGEAFTYPTVTPPELFTNRFRINRRGAAVPQFVPRQVEVTPIHRQPRWREQRWMFHYLETGWGHIMQGSPLAIAASAIPALQSAGAMRSPQLLKSALQQQSPPVALLNPEQQGVLQAGLRSVLTSIGSNATVFSNNHTPAIAQAAGYAIGGKSGTIDLDGPPPPTAAHQLLQRARLYGCGVVNATLDANDWDVIKADADSRTDGKYDALFDEHPRLPPWGFAASASLCTSLNPGMPRVPAAPMSADAAEAWNALPLLARTGPNNEPPNSSAFVTTLWPTDERRNGRRLILAVTFEHHPDGAKTASARMTNEILRLLQTRRQ